MSRGEPVEDGSLGVLLQSTLAELLARLRQQESRVLEDGPDAVHQMRVAVRTLRSVLATYRSALLPGSADEVRAELRWLGGELSPARDTEVLAERLDTLLDRQPPGLALGPARSHVAAAMAARADEGRRRALAALGGDRYERLLATLEPLVLDPPLTVTATGSARDQLPRLLDIGLRRLRRRARGVDETDDPAQHEVALHELRKAAKRLRYAAESAEPVLGRRAARLASRAERLQDLLGEHQDTVVSRRTLQELVPEDGEIGFVLGRLHALEEARAARVLEDYPATLARLTPTRWSPAACS